MHRIRIIIHDCKQVCEVSETASDAWSTDVLASDTSERPCDRLSELDQVFVEDTCLHVNLVCIH